MDFQLLSLYLDTENQPLINACSLLNISQTLKNFLQEIQYRQPNKIMAYLTFHKWLVLVCNIHNDIWILQIKAGHLWKVSYAIRLTICNMRSLEACLVLTGTFFLFLLHNSLSSQKEVLAI